MSSLDVKKALSYGINALSAGDSKALGGKKTGIGSARLDAEILLGFVLDFSQKELLLRPNHLISDAQYREFKKLIFKRKKYYPIAYLTGSKEFYGINFYVNKNVLVPRPETETLVEEVLRFINSNNLKNPNILEIGTGSGCITLTLAKYLPNARITAVDISEKALALARKNRSAIHIQTANKRNVIFKKSNLLSNITSKPDIIIANLPYLTKDELEEVSISREPRIALYGGKNGLEIYEKLFKQIEEKFDTEHLIFNIVLFLEINPSQKNEIIEIIKEYLPLSDIQIKKDLAGRDRVVIARI